MSADFVSSTPTALQRVDSPLRIASTYVHSPVLSTVIDLRDGQPHMLSLYFMEWGFNSRTLTVRIRDQASEELLDQRTISGLVEGRYLNWAARGKLQIDVHLEVGGNAILNGIFLGPVLSPVDRWRAMHFSSLELEQPELSGDNADIDADGLPNLLEHLLGFDPKTAETENPFRLELRHGQLLFTLDLARAAWDTAYTLQGSPDLVEWSAHEVQQVGKTDLANTYRLQLRAELPTPAHPQYFFRLGARRR